MRGDTPAPEACSTDMNNMFNGCCSLTSIDLSRFNTSNVTDMLWMFRDCKSSLHHDWGSLRVENLGNRLCRKSSRPLRSTTCHRTRTKSLIFSSSLYFLIIRHLFGCEGKERKWEMEETRRPFLPFHKYYRFYSYSKTIVSSANAWLLLEVKGCGVVDGIHFPYFSSASALINNQTALPYFSSCFKYS